MGVKTAQQILDAERLAPDMLDVPFVVVWTDFEMNIPVSETRCRVPSGKCPGRCWDGSLPLPSWMKSFISMFSNNGSSAYFTLNV